MNNLIKNEKKLQFIFLEIYNYFSINFSKKSHNINTLQIKTNYNKPKYSLKPATLYM